MRIRNIKKLSTLLILALMVLSSNFSAPAAGQANSSSLLAELARARAATAKYHTIARAEADGYVPLGFCEEEEGCHWVNFSLLDCDFDVTQPEILIYAPDQNGTPKHLVSVEYVQPLSCSATPPEGFTGSDDVWRQDEEGFNLWEVSAWIWLNNPNGMFVQHNPRVP